MQVCPNIIQTMDSERRPCTSGTVSEPTDWSKICRMFAFIENDSSSSDHTPANKLILTVVGIEMHRTKRPP